jgi:superfamily II DNA or RNA helicase
MKAENFSRVFFHGRFRSYQQSVLDRAENYLKDGKIHIVAAPGSGKTVLGLELVRRLDAPTLILSPSITVRHQWRERFQERFLPTGESMDDYFSEDLSRPRLMTSITYQALHNFMSPGSKDAWLELIRCIGIRTLCLDEAHHLRSEWQRSLEKLLETMGSDVRVISLTATPPYDCSEAEWQRYISTCGPIDDEIQIPELVAQKTLCPHQDYVFLNTPSAEERKRLDQYESKADEALEDLREGTLLQDALNALHFEDDEPAHRERLYENADGLIALLSLSSATGIKIPRSWRNVLVPDGRLPACDLSLAEEALQMVIDGEELFGKTLSAEMREWLETYGLVVRGRLYLHATPDMQNQMLSSMGKMDSILQIAQAEIANCGRGLRMLILTDHIRKNLLSCVGTDEPLQTMGAVPIFEALRRVCPYDTRLALLSGSLVLVPNSILGDLFQLAQERGISHSLKPLGDTWFSIWEIEGGNKEKISLLTEAFQQGLIHIMIGTKALLGEGWDSPCVNTLVLASFTGSFMGSNQMRGRAIRTDPNDPLKASNIWHLATIVPPGKGLAWLKERSDIAAAGDDLALMERRFNCFMAPAYDVDRIESGMERVSLLRPPYDAENVARINGEMLKRAADRREMADCWARSVAGDTPGRVRETVCTDRSVRPKRYTACNGGVFASHGLLLAGMVQAAFSMRPSPALALLAVPAVYSGYEFFKGAVRATVNATPEQTLKRLANALLSTLRDLNRVESKEACVVVMKRNKELSCALDHATIREKNLFAEALGEMLSPLENPRYLLIRKLKPLGISINMYSQSYACPSVLGIKKERAERLKACMERYFEEYTLVYTRTEEGRKTLLKCRRAERQGAALRPVRRKRELAE